MQSDFWQYARNSVPYFRTGVPGNLFLESENSVANHQDLLVLSPSGCLDAQNY
jgi:hypothetical protein